MTAEESLLYAIHDRKAILLLGDGHLQWSGLEDSSALIEPLLLELKEAVKKEEWKSGLLAICELLVRDRKVVEDKLWDKLQLVSSRIRIGENLDRLVRLPWRAFVTTAIDEVLSRAFDRIRDLRTIQTLFEPVTLGGNWRDPDFLTVIRLNGCIDQKSPARLPAYSAEGRRNRGKTIRALLDTMLEISSVDGVLVMAGFDPTLMERSLLREICTRVEELPSREFYFIGEEQIARDYLARELSKDLRLHIVSPERFVGLIAKAEPKDDFDKNAGIGVVATPHGKVTFSSMRWRMLRQQAFILDRATLKRQPLGETGIARTKRFREFLRGDHMPDWDAYCSSFVFRRSNFGAIMEKCLSLLKNAQSQQNSVITLSGASGSGKTILVEHVAWMLAQEGHPVAYVPKRQQQLDFQLIDGLCGDLQPKEQKRDPDSGTRLVIAWDNLGGDPEQYLELAKHLTARGRPALILGTTYNFTSKRRSTRKEDPVWNEDFPVSGRLDTEEANAFITYLKDLQLGMDEDLLLDFDRLWQGLQEDFMIALYECIPTTQYARRRGIGQEYQKFKDLLEERYTPLMKSKSKWRNLLPLVFVPSQFGCYPNLELVMRALGPDYLNLWVSENPFTTWKEEDPEIDQQDVEDLLVQFVDQGVLQLKARQPKVAQIAMDFQFKPENQLGYIRQLAEAINTANEYELDFLRNLFQSLRLPRADQETQEVRIHDYPAYRFRNMVDPLSEILKDFRLKKKRDPYLMHTEGILLRKCQHALRTQSATDSASPTYYQKRVALCMQAIEVLNEAVSLLEDKTAGLMERTECQNISNTIATAYRELIQIRLDYLQAIEQNANAQERQRDMEVTKSHVESEMSQLRFYCRQASIGSKPNAAPSHVLVTALLAKYNRDSSLSETEKGEILAEMIEELDFAECNYREENIKVLLEMRVKVLQLLGNEERQQQVIQRLEEMGSMSGYFLKARLEAYDYDPSQRKMVPRDRKALCQALNILTEMDPVRLHGSPQCLGLQARIWWDLFTERAPLAGEKRNLNVGLLAAQWEEYYQILERLLIASGQQAKANLFLHFNMGWALFQQGKYREGMERFRILDQLSQGSRYRIAPLVRIADEQGKPIIFTGDITDFMDEKRALAYCPAMRMDVSFNRYAFSPLPQLRRPISFELALNFRGPLAQPPQQSD